MARFQVLVATDIAARGIDVSSVSHVINYDIPNTADAYIHRIGRTGRAAKTGDAFTLVVPGEDDVMVRTIERAVGSAIERRTLPGFDYNAPAPARDNEFARPPREPQQRRRSEQPRSSPRTAAGPVPPRAGGATRFDTGRRSGPERSGSAAPRPRF
jgi:ATP-dependent RNA helicase RhlE